MTNDTGVTKVFSVGFLMFLIYLIVLLSAILLGTVPYFIAIPLIVVMVGTWFYFVYKLFK
jgi:hypothetical protein